MLKASISLWSADMANLEAEIRRAEPYADMFHIDVADGHYAPTLLFFPDLVSAIRGKTLVPFEVHLITERPEQWIEPFSEAGANSLIVYPDVVADPGSMIDAIKKRGMGLGVSLKIDQPVTLLSPYWKDLDVAVILGTEVGIKGVTTVVEGTYEKIRELARERKRRGLTFEIEADGGIRRETVPLLHGAGADIVVPGSLMFKNDMAEISRWFRSL
jgi:ribulose-phosphate 3-epimerase